MPLQYIVAHRNYIQSKISNLYRLVVPQLYEQQSLTDQASALRMYRLLDKLLNN